MMLRIKRDRRITDYMFGIPYIDAKHTVPNRREVLKTNNNIYRYLLSVAQTRNITRAAEELHVSQPALTKAINRLEMRLGLKLFDRESNPLRLTFAGERYIKSAAQIMELEQSLDREMQDIAQGSRGRVRMGITVERGTAWLPYILPEFKKSHPDVDVEIMQGINEDFESALLKDDLDFCVSTLPLTAELEYETVGSQPIYLISSEDHPLARYADMITNSVLHPQYLNPQLLNGQDFLTLYPGQGMYHITQQILEKYALHVNVIMKVPSQRTITFLAAAGMGLAFATYAGGLAVKAETRFNPVFYTVEDPVYQRYNIIAYKKGRILTQPMQDLVSQVRKVILEYPQPQVIPRH